MIIKTVFVNSKVTGGHWAFQSDRSKKPFTNDMKEAMSIEVCPDDIVADIGAYVGEYSLWAARCGAKLVRSYEPTPDTFQLLKTNTSDINNIQLFNVAIVGDDKKRASLYLSKGIGVTNSTAKSFRKRGMLEVPAISYEEAVSDATIVKIDVEGAEYQYNIVQDNLRAIILEFHPMAKKPWRSWVRSIITEIQEAGFYPVTVPTFKSGWSLTGSWERK